MRNLRVLSFVVGIFFATLGQAKTVQYELTISKGTINLSGQKSVDWALLVNGGIPAPTLEFTEGDDAEIVVKNSLKDDEVSIHWHGILLPPEMDGVPYVNTPPILPGKSHTFRFKIRQHGTFWYHSHTNVQEQKGVYGAFVIHPKKPKLRVDHDLVVVLSDWSDEDAVKILNNLRKDGDYYLYKKNSVRSWGGALSSGALKNQLYNEWTRMGGMDLSDVGYDAFLINGKRDSQLLMAHPGEKVRIRVINAGGSSYYYVSLANLPFQVISADGIDIRPVWTREVLIGMAETYDLLFEIPEHKNYELRATVQDVTGYGSGWIGMGPKVPAMDKPKPDLYAMMDHGAHGATHGAHGDHGEKGGQDDHKSHQNHENHEDHQSQESHKSHGKTDDHSAHMNHHTHMGHSDHSARPAKSESAKDVLEQVTVDQIRSESSTAFSKDKPRYELKLVLGGDMERYVWHINGKAIHQDRTIHIKEGDVVRFIFENETMMHHPMHLHGHFFRVLTEAGDYSPLKHTVDVPPHQSRTIEFLADEPGEWMLHCHNLYHLKTGMARVVKYTSYTPSKEIQAFQKQDPHLHDHMYFNGQVEAATNHAQLDLRLSKTWDTFELHFETRDYDNLDHSEGDLLYRRWFSNYFNILAGGTYFAEFEDPTLRGVLGVGYMLPFMIETNLMVDSKGELRLDLERRFQWTQYIYTDAEVTMRQKYVGEFEISLMYANSWEWSAGLMFTEDSAGVGAQYRF